MTGEDRAKKLLSEATTILKEARAALHENAWNLAVRRSQEVVELSLKSLLSKMDIDYPKIHDVAPLFAGSVRERRIEIDETFLEWLLTFSSTLANKRAPAFYHDEDFSGDEAKEAFEVAEKIIKFAQDLMTRMGKK